MARIAGREVPGEKAAFIGLTYIYGIGRKTSEEILTKANIDFHKKIKDLSEDELAKLREVIEKGYKVEGDLRTERALNVKRLIEIGCYRGHRHKIGLPVRGQNTQTNARTHKGPRPNSIGNKKK